jgi:uncharacterized protein
MPNPTMWFEVAGKDQPALKSFYAELFDWKFTDMEEMPYSTVDATDGGIPGGVGAAPEGHPGHVTFYVQVDDLEGSLAKSESLGGKKVMDPIDLPGGTRIAMFTDPEGHEIGLMTQPAG